VGGYDEDDAWGASLVEDWRFESQELMSLEIFSTSHVQVQGKIFSMKMQK
jgi:hypothetical protein